MEVRGLHRSKELIMSYKQVRAFNQSQGGSKKGFCLQNVRLGYAIPGKYSTAWVAWQHTEQHKNTSVPSNVDVPVYFSYTTTIGGVRKNYGHIGVRLKSGKFWSDGKVYSSVKSYVSNHAPKYVGWGESVNDVRVIKYQKPAPTKVYYRVRLFDTVTKICKKFNISLAKFKTLNPQIKNINRIFPGQKVRVK